MINGVPRAIRPVAQKTPACPGWKIEGYLPWLLVIAYVVLFASGSERALPLNACQIA